ncbi:hypothetical protein AX14_008514 [Amanita brunnescens Koide BX004]|nr:hypothetical protein AX14_008514 [Amanita brunnescens Koide BX004]
MCRSSRSPYATKTTYFHSTCQNSRTRTFKLGTDFHIRSQGKMESARRCLTFDYPALELPRLTMAKHQYYVQTVDNGRYIESNNTKDGSKVKVNSPPEIILVNHEISHSKPTTVTMKAPGFHKPALYINPPAPGLEDLVWGLYDQKWRVVPEPHTNCHYIFEVHDLTNPSGPGEGEEDKLWSQKKDTNYVSLLPKSEDPDKGRWKFICVK